MALVRCETFWGKHDGISNSLRVREINDAVYMPFSPSVFLDRDQGWGIYSLSGDLIEEAAYRRGAALQLVGQAPAQDLTSLELEEAPFEEMIYMGPILPHFGHFILTSLARTWAIEPSGNFLVHSHPVFSAHKAPYIVELSSAAGLTHANTRSFRRPTRIKRLLIPEVSLVEQNCVSPQFATSLLKVGESFQDSSEFEGKSVYLSKSSLPRGVTKFENEDIFENVFTSHGFQVVFPERLTIAQQINMFRHARLIAGTASSAFHTLALAPEGRGRRLILDYNREPNSNFALLEYFSNVKSDFFSLFGHIRQRERSTSFDVSHYAVDPSALANALCETIEETYSNIVDKSCKQRKQDKSMATDPNCVPDHQGMFYQKILRRLHLELQPRTYLEIGTLTGETLALADCSSIAIDPQFKVSANVIGKKDRCLFFQSTSDEFFGSHHVERLLDGPLDFVFLDGMHRCEFLLRDFMNAESYAHSGSVVALHDCIPVELPMTDRTQNGTPANRSHRNGWWTGDVWRTVRALRKYRPDLKLICLNAAPTGLVLISKLDRTSTLLKEHYDEIVADMMTMDLTALTVEGFIREIETVHTNAFIQPGSLLKAVRL